MIDHPGMEEGGEIGLSSELLESERLPCPRCDSRETKFCYFNNYSTAQPRHFCRNCKRYWTAGGTLRNVPVGGGLRKNKKSKISKHGKDLLSVSADGSLSPGNRNALVDVSPASSGDGTVDEAHTKPVVPLLLGYCPTFESEAVVGDYYPSPSLSFEYMNARNFAHHADALGVEQHVQDVNYGLHQPQFGFGCVDQAQSSSGEISSEPSQASQNTPVLSPLYPSYSTLCRYNETEKQANGTVTGFRENYSELVYVSKQGNSQCSVENHNLSHSSNPRKWSLTEDDDEELGNVINVRYPYDWEQVSEVLFGGAPDFFQMPTF